MTVTKLPEYQYEFLESVETHRKNVIFAGAEIVGGIAHSQLIAHDLSKYSREEFPIYAAHFHSDFDFKEQFQYAWLHHLHHNPHHWQHWVKMKKDGSATALEMPEKFALEMIADWLGAGKSYQGSWVMTDWLNVNWTKILLHPATKILVEERLRVLGYEWLEPLGKFVYTGNYE